MIPTTLLTPRSTSRPKCAATAPIVIGDIWLLSLTCTTLRHAVPRPVTAAPSALVETPSGHRSRTPGSAVSPPQVSLATPVSGDSGARSVGGEHPEAGEARHPRAHVRSAGRGIEPRRARRRRPAGLTEHSSRAGDPAMLTSLAARGAIRATRRGHLARCRHCADWSNPIACLYARRASRPQSAVRRRVSPAGLLRRDRIGGAPESRHGQCRRHAELSVSAQHRNPPCLRRLGDPAHDAGQQRTGGAPTASNNPIGVAPIAARSLTLTSTEHQPAHSGSRSTIDG